LTRITSPFEDAGVDLHVTLVGRRDLAGQVYRQLRAAIVDGRLRTGDALPATRELAARLAVSRSTVTTAYERLFGEGFVSGRVGAGTFVSALAARATAGGPRARGARLRPRPLWASLAAVVPRPAAGFDFTVGVPDGRLFPQAAWRRRVSRELRAPIARYAPYDDPAGEPALREAIARHVGAARAVIAGPGDVLVTAGAQQAFDLVARVLVAPGDVVAMEDPGYPLARDLFRAHGARVAPVPVDDEGLRVDRLPDAARVVYVTPSHQWPLGMAMSLPRRLALLAWAARRGAAVIEDDYDSEFRFGGRPVEPLQCLDEGGVVVYVGSFSKVLLPSLRLGYLIAPPSLVPALRVARQLTDWATPAVSQRALAGFIDDGLLARHVRAARREYEVRKERLERALARELGERLAVIGSAAGLHVCARFGDHRLDDEAVTRAARAAGVAVQPLSRYSIAARRAPGLVLGYGAIGHTRIDEGVRRLAACVP
jgi:GntR family transcriptional regulator/MocR family aminotransferase